MLSLFDWIFIFGIFFCLFYLFYYIYSTLKESFSTINNIKEITKIEKELTENKIMEVQNIANNTLNQILEMEEGIYYILEVMLETINSRKTIKFCVKEINRILADYSKKERINIVKNIIHTKLTKHKNNLKYDKLLSYIR